MTRRERMTALSQTFPLETIIAMREWVLDCAVDSDDFDDIMVAPNWKIVSYVDRNYDGGIPGFMEVLNT